MPVRALLRSHNGAGLGLFGLFVVVIDVVGDDEDRMGIALPAA
ncbi:MAG: hypothetical protein ABIZ07_12645 [Dermatophilaceae bacterium]